MKNKKTEILGIVVLITGPSCVGKDTVVQKLIERSAQSAVRLITTTTRAPREGEQNGRDYHFVTHKEFLFKKEQQEFLEFAHTYGQYYGSSREKLEEIRSENDIVFIIVNTKGAKAIQEKIPDSISIFLYAPIDQIKSRLTQRFGFANNEDLKKRLHAVQKEFKDESEFYFSVKNADGELENAIEQIEAIIHFAQKS